MFSDEFSKKSIYISVTGVQGTLNIIEAAMKYYLNSTSNSLRGRMSLRNKIYSLRIFLYPLRTLREWRRN